MTVRAVSRVPTSEGSASIATKSSTGESHGELRVRSAARIEPATVTPAPRVMMRDGQRIFSCPTATCSFRRRADSQESRPSREPAFGGRRRESARRSDVLQIRASATVFWRRAAVEMAGDSGGASRTVEREGSRTCAGDGGSCAVVVSLTTLRRSKIVVARCCCAVGCARGV